MPTGKHAGPQRGFTYWGLLALLALLGAGLAALGTAWSTAAQRGREAELRFRGEQIRDAIGRYRSRADAGITPAWPANLQALLLDDRGGSVRHHLRRLYADPFTGQADWAVVAAPGAAATGISGVHSRSEAALLASVAGARASDWVFVFRADKPNAASAPTTTRDTR